MELYTSLVRLKQSMNRGEMPPMTPVTGDALRLIDPAFTIGMGALEEDAARGLRCPVKGCGAFFHDLRKHINKSHRSIGPDAVLRALSIPNSVSLASTALSTKRKAIATVNGVGSGETYKARNAHVLKPADIAAGNAASAVARASVAARNLQDKCVAQLTNKVLTAHQRLGRTPNSTEFKTIFGASMRDAAIKTFGSWSNVIAHCGLPRARGMRWTTEDVLAAFGAWYKEHDDLPSVELANAAVSTPALPCADVVLRTMQCASWSEAMRRVVARYSRRSLWFARKKRSGVMDDATRLRDALDALASIWANANENDDEWTKQRAGRVLTANADRLSPDRYRSPAWDLLLGAISCVAQPPLDDMERR